MSAIGAVTALQNIYLATKPLNSTSFRPEHDGVINQGRPDNEGEDKDDRITKLWESVATMHLAGLPASVAG